MTQYIHPPGVRGKGAVLDVGLKCPHSCKFCYYREYHGQYEFKALRSATFRDKESLKEILRLFKTKGFNHFDVTGGEPTLHPELLELITVGCKELKLAGRIITLGQFLLSKSENDKLLLENLIASGLTDFLFSYHSPDAETFRTLTSGSLEKLEEAMRILAINDFQFGTNSVVINENVNQLLSIAEKLVATNVYIHNFIIFNPFHGWRAQKKETDLIQAKFSDIRSGIVKAVSLFEENDVAVNIRFAPFCVFRGLEKHIVGLRSSFFDPFEWQNRACNYDAPPSYCAEQLNIDDKYKLTKKDEQLAHSIDIIAKRGNYITVFPKQCKDCAALKICDGVSPVYLMNFGTRELVPYEDFKINGELAESRMNYQKAFKVKMKQFQRIRGERAVAEL